MDDFVSDGNFIVVTKVMNRISFILKKHDFPFIWDIAQWTFIKWATIQ